MKLYRPVSLTNIDCKTYESIIKDEKIIKHLDNLIRDSQHGFTKGRSCITIFRICQDRRSE